VVVNASKALELCAVFPMEPADDIELPEVHGPRSLPPLVVLLLPPALLRLGEAVADEGLLDRRTAGGRDFVLPMDDDHRAINTTGLG
jgi:hypothetical protein